MKTIIAQKMMIIILTIGIVGCSADPSGTTFIPGFNATWAVENDSERQIDLQPDEDNKNVHSGVFNGDEILLQSGGGTIEHPLSGSFEGLSIEFTIDREDEGTVQYTGEMIPVSETDHTIIRIELNSSKGALVLVSS